jgi:hypothetical protein
MFQIVGLIAAISAIVTMSRRRGTDIVLWGGLALCGFLILEYGGAAFLHLRGLDDDLVFAAVAGWLWIGAIFLYVRFGIGASKPKSWGMWTCGECKYLKAANAIVCEACGKPFVPRVGKSSSTLGV